MLSLWGLVLQNMFVSFLLEKMRCNAERIVLTEERQMRMEGIWRV